MEAEQKATLKQDGITNAKTDDARMVAAKAEYIRAKVGQQKYPLNAKEILNTVTICRHFPQLATPGQNFLPTTQGKDWNS